MAESPIQPNAVWETPTGRIHFPADIEPMMVHSLCLVNGETGVVVISFTRRRAESWAATAGPETEHDVVARIGMAPDDFLMFVQQLNVIRGEMGKQRPT